MSSFVRWATPLLKSVETVGLKKLPPMDAVTGIVSLFA